MALSNQARTAAFALGILAQYGILFACGLPYWSTNNWQVSDALYGRIPAFNGVWWKCMSLKNGGFTCNNYGKPTIFVEADIQTCRALMCIATIFSFFAVVISLLALDCATVVEPGTKAKRTVSLVAGIFYIIAGVCCGVAVSWWAWRVTEEYFSPFYASREFKFEYGTCLYLGWVSMLFGTCVMVATIWYGVQVQKDFYNPLKQANSFKYEYGSCLYLGWISAGLTIIAGLILTVGSCKNLREEEQSSYSPYAYNSHPSKSEMLINKTEYV